MISNGRRVAVAGTAALAFMLMASSACAQNWPNRPLRLLAPFPAGGGTDLVGRTIAIKLSEALRQPVVVENRPGAGGTIGADAVARAAPDGYTLGVATSSTHPASVVLQAGVPYDPITSFAPVSLVAETSYVMVANPALPVTSLNEFVAYAKANPGKLNFANVGSSTLGYLLSLQWKALTGTDLLDVSYKGSAQIYPDLMNGQLTVFLDNPGASTALVNSGKLKAFGVTRATPSMPGVPLFSAAGMPGFNMAFWYGIVAPAGTPRPIVDRIHGEIAKYLASAEGRADLQKFSLEPVGAPPDQFAAIIAADVERLRTLARSLKVDTPR